MRSLCLLLCSSCLLSLAASAQSPHPKVKLRVFTMVEPAKDAAGNAVRPEATTSSLTTFTYTTTSSRDGNTYTGAMVGQDPFSTGFSPTNVTTPIVPLIITTNAVAIRLNKNGYLAEVKGSTTFDPTSPDNTCLAAPNNVPETLFQQSPIFQNSDFVFGSTDVGSTQYVDAFQRANFWQFVQGTDYHTLVNPVMLPPITLNISIAKALAIPPSLFGSCGSLGIIEKKTFDSIVANTLLPQLAAEGVDTSQFPIFLMYNVVLSIAAPNNLNQCCILGYHGSSGSPAQTFSPIDFDTTGLFGPTITDTSIAAHEVGEWMDDPFGNNATPAWGHTGQVSGCLSILEVGDPLTGNNIPNVVGSNGFTYHLQELAFFSWFYGQPSIAANGWFSDNNTFKTDAGPVCQ